LFQFVRWRSRKMMNFDRFACDMGVKVRAAKGKKDAEGCQTLWSRTAELLLIV